MDIGTLIAVLFACPALWALFSLPILYYIYKDGRKHYKKNLKVYPWLSYPFYKKMFLLGLRGAVGNFTIVMTFAANILTSVVVILTVIQFIVMNTYLFLCIRIIVALQGLSVMLKTLLHLCDWPKL